MRVSVSKKEACYRRKGNGGFSLVWNVTSTLLFRTLITFLFERKQLLRDRYATTTSTQTPLFARSRPWQETWKEENDCQASTSQEPKSKKEAHLKCWAAVGCWFAREKSSDLKPKLRRPLRRLLPVTFKSSYAMLMSMNKGGTRHNNYSCGPINLHVTV